MWYIINKVNWNIDRLMLEMSEEIPSNDESILYLGQEEVWIMVNLITNLHIYFKVVNTFYKRSTKNPLYYLYSLFWQYPRLGMYCLFGIQWFLLILFLWFLKYINNPSSLLLPCRYNLYTNIWYFRISLHQGSRIIDRR